MKPSLREARSALAAALERGDVAAAGGCYADDAQLLTPAAGLIQGRSAIEQYWGTGIALGLSSVSFEARRVERLGTRRVEIGRYRVTVETEPTGARFERGTYLVLHRQAVDGTWHRAVDVLDPDEPQGSSPHPQGGKKMKRTLKLPLVLMVLVALASSFALQAAAGTSSHVGPAGHVAAADLLPFKGKLEGRHIGRTPLNPPFVFDRFETEGQATQLGQFELVIEATVNFGSRPVTGAGTYTFTAANGDQLVADHTGSSALIGPGIVLITEHAIIDPNRSTGRFAGAEGTFTVERLADAATGVGGLTVGTFEGTISRPG